MNVYFSNNYLAYLFVTPLEDMQGKQEFSTDVIKQFKKKVAILEAVSATDELRQFNSLNFEKLKGNKKDLYSIRLNQQFRLILRIFEEDVAEAIEVTEISKHYE